MKKLYFVVVVVAVPLNNNMKSHGPNNTANANETQWKRNSIYVFRSSSPPYPPSAIYYTSILQSQVKYTTVLIQFPFTFVWLISKIHLWQDGMTNEYNCNAFTARSSHINFIIMCMCGFFLPIAPYMPKLMTWG